MQLKQKKVHPNNVQRKYANRNGKTTQASPASTSATTQSRQTKKQHETTVIIIPV